MHSMNTFKPKRSDVLVKKGRDLFQPASTLCPRGKRVHDDDQVFDVAALPDHQVAGNRQKTGGPVLTFL